MVAKEFKPKNPLANSKGLALVETLPLLFIFLLLLGYGIGFFGIVHTSTLNTIAARTYAFETFRNKSNLNYFRNSAINFTDIGVRLHGITSEVAVDDSGLADDFLATVRPIALGVEPSNNGKEDPEMHNNEIFEIQDGLRNTGVASSPVWLMSVYGMCLNYRCGD